MSEVDEETGFCYLSDEELDEMAMDEEADARAMDDDYMEGGY